jgi:hypothetical protein
MQGGAGQTPTQSILGMLGIILPATSAAAFLSFCPAAAISLAALAAPRIAGTIILPASRHTATALASALFRQGQRTQEGWVGGQGFACKCPCHTCEADRRKSKPYQRCA